MTGKPPGPQPPDDPAAGNPDDELLTQRAAEGDEDAFAILVRRHGPALLRLANRLLGDRSEAEDAVQEALVSAWRRLPEFQGRASFGTWMYRIVTNRCLNVLRSRHPQDPLDGVPEAPAPAHTTAPDRIAEGRAAVHELQAALATLSPEQRTCWTLRTLDGQSYAFIARTVGISEEAVRARVFRARRQLTHTLGAWQ
ncbi:sigma-70 family RNA polymerase sigma factor [Streptomyces sp. CAI-21]|uniref:RNA polymerase sigma factor n=1 Tax=Streptomyces TaxID=1883 RepID=UPI000526C878|nr:MULTISPECIES: sigma-70 family RNA polymerase sigma factor [Streptomyces]MCX5456876.1 sigma-70 family RNA polymerase sigma factor [Streptomyces sp. FT1]NUW05802.1 sigma-70 family RNA polymerase sigma factor [Streptomyces sp. CAI-21]NVI32084.1 sigma-70 family RNA polymerase sigma factor [Streptomyces sp. CAI-17]WAC97650.1 sigma-70 family RNA polymerase sigma factor [Streptomyces sp. NA13]